MDELDELLASIDITPLEALIEDIDLSAIDELVKGEAEPPS